MPTEVQTLKLQNLRLSRALQQATMQACQLMIRAIDAEETALADEIQKGDAGNAEIVELRPGGVTVATQGDAAD